MLTALMLNFAGAVGKPYQHMRRCVANISIQKRKFRPVQESESVREYDFRQAKWFSTYRL